MALGRGDVQVCGIVEMYLGHRRNEHFAKRWTETVMNDAKVCTRQRQQCNDDDSSLVILHMNT